MNVLGGDSDTEFTLGALYETSATLEVTFGTSRTYDALADTVADHSAVDRPFVNELQESGAFVAITKLKTPLSLKLAIEADTDGKITKRKEFLVTEAAQLTPVISLPQGPLALRNVLHVITEQPLNRILLGRPELDLMDFNAKDHLASVRGKYHEHDFSVSNAPLLAALANAECKPGKIVSHLTLLSCHAGIPDLLGGDLSEDEYEDDLPDLAYSESDESDSEDEIPELEEDSSDDEDDDIANEGPEVVLASLQNAPETLFYGDIPSDDPFDGDEPDIGVEAEEDLEAAIEAMLERSRPNVSQDGFQRLTEIVYKHKKVWALKLGSQPPSKLPAMTIDLEPGAKPVRLPARTYSPPQLEFMKNKIAELESLGLIYRNPTATWASPPHIVPKAGPDQFRFTVDLRVVNASTVPRKWPTPNLADVMQNFAGSDRFGIFDAIHGYWQLELEEGSRDCQSIITPFGVYTPTRVLHGTTNATVHMQSGIEGILDPVRGNVESFMDDIAPHAQGEDAYLQNLDEFLGCFAANDTLLHVQKATLIAPEIVFLWAKGVCRRHLFCTALLGDAEEAATAANRSGSLPVYWGCGLDAGAYSEFR